MSEEELPLDEEGEKTSIEDELQDIPFPKMEKRERVVIPDGWYETTITNAGQVPNDFYDPEKEPEIKKNQLRVHFTIQHEDKEALLMTWTSLIVSPQRKVRGKTIKQSHLWTLLEAVGIQPQEFVDREGKPSELVGKKLKISVENIEKDGEQMSVVEKGGKFKSA